MTMTSAERSAAYRARHPGRVLANNAAWRERNRVATRESQRLREQRRREKIRTDVLAALGGRCTTCGFDDPRALQVDHVNDDGASDRLRFGGRSSPNIYRLFLVVIEEASNGRYQLLCANCNAVKEWDRRHRLRDQGAGL
jgi:5-methylcytosine-specific restriction endonuclease McrA